MDESSMIERLRSDADLIETVDTDVDALVGGALRQGHRRRTRRRLGAGLTGVVVAVGIAGAVLTGGATSTRTGLPALPANGPVSVSATPSPAVTPTPVAAPSSAAATATPTSPAPRQFDQVVSGTPAKVRTTLVTLLPKAVTVTEGSAAREEGSNGFDWENNAALTGQDAAGTTYLNGGIGNGYYDDACFGYTDCTTTELPGGGTLWVSSSTGGDKAGTDTNVYYNRPEGGHVWFSERNYLVGNGPVTRTGLALSEAEGRALVTSTRWDDLFRD